MACCRAAEFDNWCIDLQTQRVEEKDYCIFHNPDPAKHSFSLELLDSLNSARRTGNACNLSGTFFPDNVIFKEFASDDPFPEIILKKSTFNARADFDGLVIEKITFTGATFRGDADFTGTRFCERAVFNSTTFHKNAIFDNVKFDNQVSFTLANFEHYSSFFETQFVNRARFAGVTFKDYADFEGAIFHEQASFNLSIFKSLIEFDSVTFKKQATFMGCEFNDKIDFSNTTFVGNASFNRGKFKANVLFKKTPFRDGAFFIQSFFFEEVDFSGAIFVTKDREINFSKAIFSNIVNFNETIFDGKTFFQETNFNNQAYFTSCKFMNFVRFLRAQFKKDSYFWKASFQKEARFHNVLIAEILKFEDVDLAKTSFMDSDLRKMNFVNCRWVSFSRGHQSLYDEFFLSNKLESKSTKINVFSRIKDFWNMPDEKKAKIRKVETLYRMLKQKYKEEHNEQEASKWHYSEMEMLRKRTGIKEFFQWAIVNLYFISNGYGEEPLRAFLVLTLLFIMAMYSMAISGLDGYLILGGFDPEMVKIKWPNNFHFKEFGKLFIVMLKYLSFQKDVFVRPITLGGECILFFVQVFMPVQAALLVFALRNKFRR